MAPQPTQLWCHSQLSYGATQVTRAHSLEHNQLSATAMYDVLQLSYVNADNGVQQISIKHMVDIAHGSSQEHSSRCVS